MIDAREHDPHPDDAEAEAEHQHGRAAAALIPPSGLRPPSGWWREHSSSRTTPEGFTETTTFRDPDPGAAIAAAVDARKVLQANPRREPPKTIVGQVIAFFTMHGLPPPQEVVEALAAAMSVNRRVPDPSFADVAEAVEAARLATADTPVPRRERAVVLQVVRWFAGRGDVLPAEVFHAVIVALELTDAGGRLRQRIRESILPKPKPEMRLTGVEWDDEGPMAVWRERPAEQRVGLRKPNLIEAAVEYEARQRLDFATEEDEDGELEWGPDEDPTKQETPHRMLARNLSASPNTIRALVESTAYQMAVYSRVFWRSKLSRQWRWRRDDR